MFAFCPCNELKKSATPIIGVKNESAGNIFPKWRISITLKHLGKESTCMKDLKETKQIEMWNKNIYRR